jgi:hypothetical protein
VPESAGLHVLNVTVLLLVMSQCDAREKMIE